MWLEGQGEQERALGPTSDERGGSERERGEKGRVFREGT